MSLPKLVVGITQGDSNGIGYEVIIKALADERYLEGFTPVIYGSSKLMGFYRKTVHNIGPMDINVISSAADARQRKVNLVKKAGKEDTEKILFRKTADGGQMQYSLSTIRTRGSDDHHVVIGIRREG